MSYELVLFHEGLTSPARRSFSVTELEADVKPLRPEIGFLEEDRWVRAADEPVKLIARADHVADVEEVVAREDPGIVRDLVADVHVRLGDHGEPVTGMVADVVRAGEETAG